MLTRMGKPQKKESRQDVESISDWGIQGKEGMHGGWMQRHFEKQKIKVFGAFHFLNKVGSQNQRAARDLRNSVAQPCVFKNDKLALECGCYCPR